MFLVGCQVNKPTIIPVSTTECMETSPGNWCFTTTYGPNGFYGKIMNKIIGDSFTPSTSESCSETKDECYSTFASNTGDLNSCYKINNEELKSNCENQFLID